MTKGGSVLFGIIGTLTIFLATTNVNSMQNAVANNIDDGNAIIPETRVIPKKDDLLGTYIVKDDKSANLILRNDGTYALTINVCDDYLLLTGNYELRDSKLKLYNSSSLYEELEGNEELTFTIIDENTIKSDESLVCTVQETLFVK